MQATRTAELLRSALPPTQAEAAKLLNVSQAAISKLLSGKFLPSYKTAIAAEKTGKVTRYQLRPDIFGPAPQRPEAVAERRGLPVDEAVKQLLDERLALEPEPDTERPHR